MSASPVFRTGRGELFMWQDELAGLQNQVSVERGLRELPEAELAAEKEQGELRQDSQAAFKSPAAYLSTACGAEPGVDDCIDWLPFAQAAKATELSGAYSAGPEMWTLEACNVKDERHGDVASSPQAYIALELFSWINPRPQSVDELAEIKLQLAEAKLQHAEAKLQLANTKSELADTKLELADTKSRLAAKESHIAELQSQVERASRPEQSSRDPASNAQQPDVLKGTTPKKAPRCEDCKRVAIFQRRQQQLLDQLMAGMVMVSEDDVD
ncbi:hypothetical protein C8A03DRAFT_37023 [Achaetomium macrosporum]|uniref:Uncharacterized protein n=1 Tax=Achaetomium macrosporum TaxID=79813 RepID=A0AAN7C4M0_9PEZI|nr:hypothetical protein C8A03DRAFT_37023 [Achaetomium macrosporum]